MYFVVNFTRELGDQTAASFKSVLAGRCARHERNFLVEFLFSLFYAHTMANLYGSVLWNYRSMNAFFMTRAKETAKKFNWSSADEKPSCDSLGFVKHILEQI